MIFFPDLVIIGIISIGIGIYLFTHRRGKRPSTKQKHTAKRSGEVYDKAQNQKRGGGKNRKYKKPDNPNKTGNKKQ